MLYFRGIESYKATWKWEKLNKDLRSIPWIQLRNSHTEGHTITNRAILAPNTHIYTAEKQHKRQTSLPYIIFKIYLNSAAPRVVKSSPLPAKIAAYLFSIGRLLCLAFLYRWHFLNKISLDWPLTLTTQLSTSKLSDNPKHHNFLHIPWCSIKDKHTCRFSNRSSSFFGNINIFRELKYRWE